MINIKRLKKYFTVLSAVLLLTAAGVGSSVAETLTASTSLTVVNVTSFVGVDVTQWPGAWPQPPVAPETAADIGNPVSQEVYLNNVYFTSHSMAWATFPQATPYPPFYNGINSMICAVWSTDGGKTFKLQSWDYLIPTSNGKGLEEGMPNCWMGTMVHTLCDRKAGECNGRYRSNLIFEEFTSGSTGCWGSAVMN